MRTIRAVCSVRILLFSTISIFALLFFIVLNHWPAHPLDEIHIGIPYSDVKQRLEGTIALTIAHGDTVDITACQVTTDGAIRDGGAHFFFDGEWNLYAVEIFEKNGTLLEVRAGKDEDALGTTLKQVLLVPRCPFQSILP
jgi:hypothetical protein